MVDLAELRSFDSVATDGRGRFAYIVIEPSLATGKNRYFLYELGPDRTPLLLLAASSIRDLSYRSNTRNWVVRADLGRGTQLYSIDHKGNFRLLVQSPYDPVVTGPWNAAMGGIGSPEKTAVQSYQVSANGECIWYSVLRQRTAVELQRYRDRGLVYDESMMSPLFVLNDPGRIKSTELYLRCNSQTKRLLSLPFDQHLNLGAFNRAFTHWTLHDRAISYRVRDPSSGALIARIISLSGKTSHDHETDEGGAIATQDGSKLQLRREGDKTSLVISGPHGDKVIGSPRFTGIKSEIASFGEAGRRIALLVDYDHGNGIAVVDSASGTFNELGGEGSYGPCAVSWSTNEVGCVWQSLTDPPLFVIRRLSDWEVVSTNRPNSRLNSIPKLTYKWRTWVNRLGSTNTGFILYPRAYQKGVRYPAVLISHGTDARDAFAPESLQWNFPLQVLAEEGFVVLAVNEPVASAQVRANFANRVASGPKDMQRAVAFDAIASFESAVSEAVAEGLVDKHRVGIVGYSRGGELVGYTMTQSRMFHAGIIGESGVGIPNGSDAISLKFRNELYGGSPYDRTPSVMANYDRLAVPFRLNKLAGPLLFEYGGKADAATEIYATIRAEGIPSELVIYSGESHLFWNPRHRLSAMRRCLDWLGFWLKGSELSNPADSEQYSRWRAMRDQYDDRKVLPH